MLPSTPPEFNANILSGNWKHMSRQLPEFVFQYFISTLVNLPLNTLYRLKYRAN